MSAVKSSIPDNIQEEYYQIAKPILESFPKYRPPVDLFVFKLDVGRLQGYSRKGSRLSNEQVEEVHTLCAEGNLFVSRTDHPIYSKHIVKQLDLVLVDRNLKQGEIADVVMQALSLRMDEFCEQPVKPVFESLYRDTLVFTEFLSQDKHSIKLFMRRLYREGGLASQAVNTLICGLWLFFQTRKDWPRRTLDKVALGLILHDVGMCKVPMFIRSKTAPLKIEEMDKVMLHPLAGAKLMYKVGLAFDELKQATLEHHERLDGSGYPQKSTQISSFGRLVAVADSFSAMITNRSHAEGMEPEEAAAKLAQDKTRYDEKYTSLLHSAYLTEEFALSKKK